MKPSIFDEQFTPDKNDEEDDYQSSDGEKLRNSKNTYHYFECISYGQLFRFSRVCLITDYSYGEDSVLKIVSLNDPVEEYQFVEDAEDIERIGNDFSDIKSCKINGVTEQNGRLIFLLNRKQIKQIHFNHENKTYYVVEEFELGFTSKEVPDEEQLWLIKVVQFDYYFARSYIESRSKDFTAIVRLDKLTNDFEQVLNLETENLQGAWLPQTAIPDLDILIHFPTNIINLQKVSVTQEILWYSDKIQFYSQQGKVVIQDFLFEMEILAEGMKEAFDWDSPPTLNLKMTNKQLSLALFIDENDRYYLFDVRKNFIYQLKRNISFLQHSVFMPDGIKNVYFDLIYFKSDSNLWCLSFTQNGDFKFLQWKTQKTSDKPECVLISRDGGHILFEKIVKTETNSSKPQIEKTPDIVPFSIFEIDIGEKAAPQVQAENKDKPQVLAGSYNSLRQSMRQKSRAEKRFFKKAYIQYINNDIEINTEEKVIENFEEIIQNPAFKQRMQQNNNPNNYERFKEILFSFINSKNVWQNLKQQDIDFCTYRKWILVCYTQTKKDQALSSIYFYNPSIEDFDFAIEFPYKITRIEVDYLSDQPLLFITDKIESKILILKLFKEQPGSIPEYLINRDGLFTVMDLVSGQIKYFESFANRNQLQQLAFVKINQDLKIWDEETIFHFIAENQSEKLPLDQVFGINIVYRQQLFKLILSIKANKSERRVFFSSLMNKLQEPRKKNQAVLIPMDFTLSSQEDLKKEEQSIFQMLSQMDLVSLRGELIETFLTYMIQTDTTGQLYQSVVEDSIENIAEVGLNLKAFLNSKQAYPKINTEDVAYEEVLEVYKPLFSSNSDSIQEILKQFDTTIEIPNDQAKNSTWRKFKTFFFGQKVEQQRVNYHIVNLKNTLNPENSLKFLQMVYDMAEKDISVMDIPCIRTIIEYKWDAHTFTFFFQQLIAILLFYISFVVDIYYWMILESPQEQQKAFIVTRVICGIIILYFFGLELRQLIINSSIGEYLSQFWNYNDILLFMIYPIYVAVAFSKPDELYVIKTLQCIIVLVSFIKIQFLIRIFDGLSFLVQMLSNVFKDIGWFLLFFAIVIGAFATAWTILDDKIPESYEGITKIGYFAMGLRRALGDNDTDELVANSKYKVLAWIFWLIIVIVGNIVFMNFVIAVVGSSYEACMETQEQQSYLAKLHMIIEREGIMFEWKKSQNAAVWFPKFIIKVSEVEESSDSAANDAQATTKAIKDLKKLIEAQQTSIKKEVKSIKTEVNQQMQELKKQINDLIWTVNNGQKKNQDDKSQGQEELSHSNNNQSDSEDEEEEEEVQEEQEYGQE